MTKDLTQQMLDDFKPYVRHFEMFKQGVLDDVEYFGGGVQRIIEVPFPNRSGIMEKRYYFPEDGEDDPLYVLNAFECGEENSL